MRLVRRGTVLAGVVLGGALTLGLGPLGSAHAASCSSAVQGVYLCSQPTSGGSAVWVAQDPSGFPITAGAAYGEFCTYGQQTLEVAAYVNGQQTLVPVPLGSC